MVKHSYILVFGLMVSACTTSENQGTVISILEDITETDFIAKPNAKSISDQFNLKTDPWHSAVFRYGCISSLNHNGRKEYVLESEKALLGNQLKRKGEVRGFENAIEQILKTDTIASVHQYSTIWTPLVAELKILQQYPNSQCTLYVFSDLQENNATWFSVHRYKDLRLLEQSPKKVTELFLTKAQELQKGGSNLKVVVVYRPRTMKEDAAFSKMITLYKAVFGELNISIEFKANLY